ncbi:MAG: DUF6155 family protein [Methanobrevibacter sp.]|jgi:hypothetical protein|nr:DUF6155 family protein [Candidatus Methanoflexus mossambicus]
MSKKDLKNYLKNLDNNELINIILRTYIKNEDAKLYLDYLIKPDSLKLNEKEEFLSAKEIIKEEYFSGEHPPIFYIAKKAVSDFRRIDPSIELIADLLLFLVEQCGDFAKNYCGPYDPIYDIIESNYEIALEFIYDNDLLCEFKSRAENIIDISHDEYFNSILCDIYFGFYLEIEDT